jgi:glycosyltransferase involved in cell wall biosynthesis
MTVKPKILFLYPALAIDTDFLIKTYELLSDRYDVTVVTPERCGFPNLGIAEKTLDVAARQKAAPHVRIVALPLLHPTQRYLRTIYSPRRLARVFREVRPDIVHVCSEVFSPTLSQAIATLRYLGIPAKVVNFSFENLDWYRFPFSVVGKWNLARLDAVFAVNHEATGEIKKFGTPKQVFGSGFACDLELFPYRPRTLSDEKITIGFIGRHVSEKGLDLVIEAARRLANPRISLLVAGDGPERTALESLAHDAGVTAEFVGRVPAERLSEEFFGRIDLLVVPSKSVPTWKEQFGRVIVEGMAAGVPVIGSSSGAIPEVIGEYGEIFRESDAEDLAEKIRVLLSDPERCARYSREAQKYARENHSLEAYAEKLDATYRAMRARA